MTPRDKASTMRRLLAISALPAAAAPALAAAEGNANPMSFQAFAFICGLVVFIVFFVILNTSVLPKILSGLRDREQKIRSEIESAENARKSANDALRQYEKSLAEARAEATAMLERTKGEQQKLASELRAKADAELTLAREAATRDIEAAKREAVNEIYAMAASMASELAAKILKREIRPEDHRRLIEESLGELETAARR